MAQFTKALRQHIVREFAVRHNGTFNPNLFLDEVRKTGPSHPAHAWFDWNRDEAARKWQVEQAREFARDLRVTFKVEEVGRAKAISVKEREMPLVMSPVEGRSHGGGYVLTDPNDPDHMAEHCLQAAMALRSWLNRYSAALAYAGSAPASVLNIVGALEVKSPQTASAA